jgi:hypothetical protein
MVELVATPSISTSRLLAMNTNRWIYLAIVALAVYSAPIAYTLASTGSRYVSANHVTIQCRPQCQVTIMEPGLAISHNANPAPAAAALFSAAVTAGSDQLKQQRELAIVFPR